MGEYVKYRNDSAKVGTCEDLYYATYQAFYKAVKQGLLSQYGNNPTPQEFLKSGSGYRFRFPFPWEDETDIFNYDYDAGFSVPVEPGTELHKLLTDEYKLHENEIEIVQQKHQDDILYTVFKTSDKNNTDSFRIAPEDIRVFTRHIMGIGNTKPKIEQLTYTVIVVRMLAGYFDPDKHDLKYPGKTLEYNPNKQPDPTPQEENPEESPQSNFFGLFKNDNEVRDTSGMLLHEHEKTAIAAFRGTSFSPERRGRYYVKEYSEQLKSDLEHVAKYNGDAERYKKKYIDLWLNWLHAKGRCVSSMITGPSNFPVRRAEKLNRWEESAGKKFFAWREKALKGIERRHRKEQKKDIDPIEEYTAKLNKRIARQQLMKDANKILRSKTSEIEKRDLLAGLGLSETDVNSLLVPDDFGGVGFSRWQLSNNLANIKRMQGHLKTLKAKAEAENTEQEIKGIKVVRNFDADRLQLFFPDKPDAATRNKVKSHGFRWSPSNGCWQRKLTNNAIYVTKRLLAEL